MNKGITIGIGAALLVGLVAGGRARGQDGDGSAALFQQSYDEEAAGRQAAALAALDRLPEARAVGYVAQLRRGWLYYRLGRNLEAIEAYGKAAALAPGSVEARVGMLLPLLGERRWSSAEKTAREALKIEPGNYLATLRLAWSLYNLGRYGEAVTAYKKLSDAYPGDVEVRTGLGWALLKHGRTAEAAAQFREVLDVSPKNTLARDGLAAAGGKS